MLLKLIHGQVELRDKTNFSKGQLCWHELSKLNGFLGQLGGWLVDRTGHAVSAMIVGLWQDECTYQNFMANHHDSIADSANQCAHYEAIHVTLWHTIDQNSTDYDKLAAAISKARSIVIARAGPSLHGEKLDNLFPDAMVKVFQRSTSVLAKLSLESNLEPCRMLTCVLSDGQGSDFVNMCNFDNPHGLPIAKSDNSKAVLDILRLEVSWTVLPLSQPSAH